MLLSDDTPHIEAFKRALNPSVKPVTYSFSSADGPSLVALLKAQVQQNGGKQFESIALANFGSSSTSSASWPLSAKLSVGDAAELYAFSPSDAAQFFRCLGNSVVPGGRVDIFACGVFGTARSMAALSGIRKDTRTHFAGAAILDANPTSKGRFIMSDGYDIKPLYFISSNADGGGDSGGGRGMGARISFATEVQEPPPDDFVSLRQEMLGHDKRSTVSSGGSQLGHVDAGAITNLLSISESENEDEEKKDDEKGMEKEKEDGGTSGWPSHTHIGMHGTGVQTFRRQTATFTGRAVATPARAAEIDGRWNA